MTNATWMYNRYAYHPAPGSPLWVSLEQAMAARGVPVSSTAGCLDANSTTACSSIDEAAVQAAVAAADVIVFCVGTGEKVESEVVDHGIGATLALPGQQGRLIEMGLAAKGKGKRVVVLLFTTSPKKGPWMAGANAVMQCNYPQSGGAAAIADTLLGRVSPGGRLPLSWPKHWCCDMEPAGPNGRTRGRCEILPAKLLGSNLTYRYGSSDNVLFPFGYGLGSRTWGLQNAFPACFPEKE